MYSAIRIGSAIILVFVLFDGRGTASASVATPAPRLSMAANSSDETEAGSGSRSAVKQELKRHMRRIAKLTTMRTVAVEAEKYDRVRRLDKLIEKENVRHQNWMDLHQ